MRKGAISITVLAGAAISLSVAALVGLTIIPQALDAKPENVDGRINISSEEQMKQMVVYDRFIAHYCANSSIRGIVGWKEFYFYNKEEFSALETAFQDVGRELKCKGSEFTLPGTGSTPDNTVQPKRWRNDQEGIDSKIKFRVDEEIILNGPVYEVKLSESSTGALTQAFIFAGPEMKNAFEGTQKFTGSAWIDIGDDRNKGGEKEYTDSETVTIFHEEGRSREGENVVWQKSNNDGSDHFEMAISNWKFCKGAEGYVQTNTGSPGEPRYDPETNPPGNPLQEKGPEDWRTHPYIVITKRGECEGSRRPDQGVEQNDVVVSGNNFGTRMTLYMGGGMSGSLDQLTSEKDKSFRKFNLDGNVKGEQGARCMVRVDRNGKDAASPLNWPVAEGTLVEQDGPIFGQPSDIIQPTYDTDGIFINLNGQKRKSRQDAQNSPKKNFALLFNSFDAGPQEREVYRKNTGGNKKDAGLATEVARFNEDETVKDRRFLVRPDGELICANHAQNVQWVKCSPSMRGEEVYSRGQEYECFVGTQSYKESGTSSWRLTEKGVAPGESVIDERQVLGSSGSVKDCSSSESCSEGFIYDPESTGRENGIKWDLSGGQKQATVEFELMEDDIRGSLAIGSESHHLFARHIRAYEKENEEDQNPNDPFFGAELSGSSSGFFGNSIKPDSDVTYTAKLFETSDGRLMVELLRGDGEAPEGSTSLEARQRAAKQVLYNRDHTSGQLDLLRIWVPSEDNPYKPSVHIKKVKVSYP